jgi:hypothetical protein
MNCNDLYPISFRGQYVGALVTAYDSLEVVICDSKSEAFASALESEGWHQVSNHGTLECKEVIDLKSWYLTLEKKLIVSVGPHTADFKIMSFEELRNQEESERDLAELNPIAELLGKPTQLTKEEDAYNKGYNAALDDLFVVLDAYDIEITTDDRYLTYMKIFNKIELAKEALQKPTNSKEV